MISFTPILAGLAAFAPLAFADVPEGVLVSSALADVHVNEASIPDASVFVSGTWTPVTSDPNHHTNDVTVGNTIAWLPGPIMTYNDL
ncbi:hypothetical protein BC830DRAFT_1175263, partial [Chytriomyces sp. MP71]